MKAFGNITRDGQVRAIASGAMTDGKAVIVNSDGTVSVVAETGTAEAIGSPVTITQVNSYISAVYDPDNQKVIVAYKDTSNSDYGTAAVGTIDTSDNSISFGTPTVFNSTGSDYVYITYDSGSDKVVIAFRYVHTSYDGRAVVGTVSGNSISFGTPAQFTSNDVTYVVAAYDATNNKTVIAYKDQGNSDGRAVVATVSGTSISFGTIVQFDSSDSRNISIVYDSNAGKVVINYRDRGNSDYGTSIVGTVSGTSISFGTGVVFNQATTSYTAAAYDANSQKIVVFFRDGGNSNKGTAIVGTVSGTSISFGSETLFEDAAVEDMFAAYHSGVQKVIIAFRDDGNSGHGTVAVGTVSGTSITFTTPSVFEAASTAWIGAAYDANADRVVIVYRDGGNSNAGTAIVFKPATISTNLTSSENFIGFSDGAFADGQSAVINTTNTIDRNQSSLTAGQTLFVQTDGTLGETADSPSVTAGTAISATEIIVKG